MYIGPDLKVRHTLDQPNTYPQPDDESHKER